jgi:hypothetical protein
VSKYTTAEKKRALDLYVLYGPCRASRETGIPKGTITRWAIAAKLESKATQQTEAATKAQQAVNAAKRAKIMGRLLDEALYCMDAIHNPHVEFKGQGALPVTYPVAPASAVQNYATSLAIFIDKFRLENGEVTGREEVVTVDAVDRAIQQLESELARRPVDARTAEAN